MKHLEGKMKFLAVKLSALQSELLISREIFNQASREVDNMFKKKYFPEIPPEPEEEEKEILISRKQDNQKENNKQKEDKSSKKPQQEEKIEISSTKKNIMDPEVKKLFRKISLKIHPDKLIHLEEGYEKERKSELYLRAMKSAEENDLITLSDIALEIGLPPPEISVKKLKEAENKIIAIKKELSHIESTVVWQWFFCSNEEQKRNILEKLFELMYENQKNQNPGS